MAGLDHERMVQVRHFRFNMVSIVMHPLEPLSQSEVQQAVQLLRESGNITTSMRFVSVSLLDPTKQAFRSACPLPREAFVSLFDNAANACYEAVVSLTEARLLNWKHIPGVQPTITIDEQIECEQAVLASPEFKAALERHYGVSDTSLVMVDFWSAGNYGNPEERQTRLARPLCFLRADPTDNGYARPIEGIRPVVDVNTMKVVRIEDYGRWPAPPESCNYAASRQPQLRQDIATLSITQPNGPGFRVEGRVLHWQNWSLVVGFNAREGLTLHNVSYNDQGNKRDILFRASLTEMVVPYGDPSPTQFRKNAFDVGEYGMGMCANSLVLGCDCLGEIRYLDAEFCTSRGEPLTIRNAICMHEEDYGILWKHTDRRFPDRPEVRRSRRMVISSVSTVENYEYGFFWYLYQDGNIQFEIKLTGILSLRALQPDERSPYGTLVAPQLCAPIHQHFFNVRLNFDLDGGDNSAYRVDVLGEPLGMDNPHGNAFAARPTLLETESQSLANVDTNCARTWRIENRHKKNAVGDAVAYKFVPGDNCVPFANADAWWRRRAGFVNHHVWVTPSSPTERYAAGDYPNQGAGFEGLSQWVQQDRPIVDSDLVLWYTFGHTHVPRPEDYPVMPAAYLGFMLKPQGFFKHNPANDLPPDAPKKSCCK